MGRKALSPEEREKRYRERLEQAKAERRTKGLKRGPKRITEEERKARIAEYHKTLYSSNNPKLTQQLNHEDNDRNRFYRGRTYGVSLDGKNDLIKHILHGGMKW